MKGNDMGAKPTQKRPVQSTRPNKGQASENLNLDVVSRARPDGSTVSERRIVPKERPAK
jgi:hypothetical protein